MGDFVAPFLTLLLTRRLGYSEARAGVWVTVTVISGLLGILAAGRISDSYGRKPVLAAGMGISAVLIAAGGFFPQNPLIIYFLVLMSFFQGMVRPAIAALIADLTCPEERKDAYALNYLGINVGVALGLTLAGFLFEHNLHLLFWIDSFSSFAALALIFIYIPKTCTLHFSHNIEKSGDEKHQDGSALKAFFKRPLLAFFCLLLMIVNIIYSQTHFALPLYTGKLFNERGALIYGWLMSCNALVVVTLTPIVSHLTRKQGPEASMSLGTALYSFGFAMMAFPLTLPLLFFSTFIWTIGEILFSINTGVYMAAKTPGNLRGQFQAYREFITSLGRMAAPLLAGLLISGLGIYVMWIATASLGLLAVIGFIFLDRAEKPIVY